MKKLMVFVLLFVCSMCHAESIGFGVVVAVKQYDIGSDKGIKIYLDPSATYVNSACLESARVYGKITPSLHDEPTINRMFSLVMAAYMSGKKIRLHSETNSCEIDFVAMQEAVF